MTNEESKSGRDQAKEGIKEGVRAITGFLAALKDAIDETIRDVKASGDLDPDRAREAVRSTMKRAADAVDDVKDRLDFVPRREFEALQAEVASLRARVAELENRGGEGGRSIPIDGA
jgi:polyhydroxyalkanoate synthesis regulator phasin